MRRALFTLALVLAACSQVEPPPLPEAVSDEPNTWFICDGVDAPSLIVFERDQDRVRMAEYGKPSGALALRDDFTLAEQEGAGGSLYTPLINGGVASGAIRETNPGMLENPASAYTPRYSEIRIGERTITCRWLPRTRLFGFTGRRSFAVHEDADGDLIYTAYGFSDVSALEPIELSEDARTTPFSVEVRGGEEMVSPNGVEYRFYGADNYIYVLTAERDGRAHLNIYQGETEIQSEVVIAFQQGDAAAP